MLGVRADFEARCANYPQLGNAVQDRYLVTSMTERQLRMAIAEPAEMAGSHVDDDLVEVLLAEVRTRQPGVRWRGSAAAAFRTPLTRPGGAGRGTLSPSPTMNAPAASGGRLRQRATRLPPSHPRPAIRGPPGLHEADGRRQ